MDDLLAQIGQGSRRAVARVITQVERSEQQARAVVKALYSQTGRAHIIGTTGAPGTGKSTLVNEMAKELRRRSFTVGIVAVDPSSPFTGGALLGDRIRMRDLSGDPGVFIRSMASRGSLGGLARATLAVVKVLDAAGYDVVLVETVGAGQAEVDIANMAHTTLVIEAPGMGDEIQSIKAGILEIADVLIVNKADRPGASNTVKALRMMLHMGQTTIVRHHGRAMASSGLSVPAGDGAPDRSWQVQVYETIATEGNGVAAVVEAILAHKAYLKDSGEWEEREECRSRQEIEQILQVRLMERLARAVPNADREELVAAVAARKTDPYSAANELFERMGA